MTDVDPDLLRELVGRLEVLIDRRLATRPRSAVAAARAERLRDHLASHLRVRANSLDAPLLVLLLGPTGAGKSSLFNAIAGRAASETGVLRPTTRLAVVLLDPADREALLAGGLAHIDPGRLRLVEDADATAGLALVDAPDLDSIEYANREMADQLVEAADLCIFVTTATRYADRVPWTVLGRVRDRGLPLVVVVNRMPPGTADQDVVLADVKRLLAEGGLAPIMDAGRIELVAIGEGAVDPERQSLSAEAIRPIADRIAALRQDREARVALAARALTGSLAGLGQVLDEIADDAEHEAIDVDALRRTAGHHFERALVGLRDELGRGAFLREEALGRWQAYVGADQMTRFFSEGIGRIRGALAGLFHPAVAPVAELRAATTEDLIAVARLHAAEAARRTATAWADQPTVGAAIAADPALWGTSPDFDERISGRMEGWIESIGAEIAAKGRPKRLLARGASVGVNALGTGVMLATFMHTGGLTGAEVGVAAATALLNQKLLSALFGEAAMAELIGGARRRLDELLATTFGEELARFDRLLPASDELTGLAAELRAAAGETRALPAGLPSDLRATLAASSGDGQAAAGSGGGRAAAGSGGARAAAGPDDGHAAAGSGDGHAAAGPSDGHAEPSAAPDPAPAASHPR